VKFSVFFANTPPLQGAPMKVKFGKEFSTLNFTPNECDMITSKSPHVIYILKFAIHAKVQVTNFLIIDSLQQLVIRHHCRMNIAKCGNLLKSRKTGKPFLYAQP